MRFLRTSRGRWYCLAGLWVVVITLGIGGFIQRGYLGLIDRLRVPRGTRKSEGAVAAVDDSPSDANDSTRPQLEPAATSRSGK